MNTEKLSFQRELNSICDRFEDAWLAGDRPRILDYIGQADDESLQGQLFAALLDLELFYRKQNGVAFDPSELQSLEPRFNTIISDKLAEFDQAAPETSRHAAKLVSAGASFNDGPTFPDAESAWTELASGKKFGRYHILRLLGQGGMGSVYLAKDSLLDREVALKIPSFDPQDQQLVQRFYREAKAAALLQHRNICPVYDIGRHDGRVFITMAFISGAPLSSYISGSKPLSENAVAKIVRNLALALQDAHDRGIVHRDIKPANIIIDKKSEPVLTDFGLARQASINDSHQLTRSGILMGTPAYMSPEQIRDCSAAGPSADIYSLGVVMYQMLTRQLPFRGDIVSIISQIIVEEPLCPSEIRPSINPELVRICLKAMAKQPEDRFGNMTEFARCLTDFLRQASVASTALSSAESTQKTTQKVAQRTTQKPLQDRQDRSADGSESVVKDTDNLATTGTRLPTPSAPAEVANTESPIEPAFVFRLRWYAWVGAVLLGVLGVGVWLSTILFVATPNGYLRIEINDPSINVVVNTAGVTINGTDKSETVQVEANEPHLLKITRGDLEFTAETFAIKRGDQAIVSVALVNDQIEAKQDGTNLPLVDASSPGVEPASNAGAEVVSNSASSSDVDRSILQRLQASGAKFWITLSDATTRELSDDEFIGDFLEVVSEVNALDMTKFDAECLQQSIRLFPRLRYLRFSADHIASDAMQVFKDSSIEKLELRGQIQDEKFRWIGSIKSLKDLGLYTCGFNDSGLKHLAGLQQLTSLNLDSTSLQGPGLKYLSKLANLSELGLNGTAISARDLEALQAISSLQVLDLSDCKNVTDLEALRRTKLTNLGLRSVPFRDISPIKELPVSAIVLDYDPQRDKEVLGAMKKLFVINGKSRDEFLAATAGDE